MVDENQKSHCPKSVKAHTQSSGLEWMGCEEELV